MKRIVTRRPSPALIIAVLALVAALAGTALAGSGSGGSGLTNNQVKRIAAKQITKRAPTLSVASATTANAADTAAHATNADLATSATTATSADTAAHATDADQASSATTADDAAQLEGLAANAFARSTQIDSGSGDNTATAQTRLVSFPDIGLQVRTDGDADSSNALRLVNSRATGTFLYWSTGSPNAVGILTSSGNLEVAGPAANPLNHDLVIALQATPPAIEPTPVISITCRFSVPPTVACIGIRSR
jgi:hypothetical protein